MIASHFWGWGNWYKLKSVTIMQRNTVHPFLFLILFIKHKTCRNYTSDLIQAFTLPVMSTYISIISTYLGKNWDWELTAGIQIPFFIYNIIKKEIQMN